MDVTQAIEKRRSIRKYRSDPVPGELLDRLLDSARLAPSTSNTQSWKFKVITDAGTRIAIQQAAYAQKFVGQAPVLIACCVDFNAFKDKGKQALKLVMSGAVRPSMEMILRSVKGGKDKDFDPERVVINGVMNVSIATEHVALAAVEAGLGTCWVRAFDAAKVERILGLPEGVTVLCLMTLGYPDQEPAARPRRRLDEILA